MKNSNWLQRPNEENIHYNYCKNKNTKLRVLQQVDCEGTASLRVEQPAFSSPEDDIFWAQHRGNCTNGKEFI